jgi:hypothetical protein
MNTSLSAKERMGHVLSQHRLHSRIQELEAELAERKATEQVLRQRLQASEEAAREAGRETSFYWMVLSRIGRALKVVESDMPAGAPLNAQWRNYANAVQSQVCQPPASMH